LAAAQARTCAASGAPDRQCPHGFNHVPGSSDAHSRAAQDDGTANPYSAEAMPWSGRHSGDTPPPVDHFMSEVMENGAGMPFRTRNVIQLPETGSLRTSLGRGSRTPRHPMYRPDRLLPPSPPIREQKLEQSPQRSPC